MECRLTLAPGVKTRRQPRNALPVTAWSAKWARLCGALAAAVTSVTDAATIRVTPVTATSVAADVSPTSPALCAGRTATTAITPLGGSARVAVWSMPVAINCAPSQKKVQKIKQKNFLFVCLFVEEV
jgi:hypothetical protein